MHFAKAPFFFFLDNRVVSRRNPRNEDFADVNVRNSPSQNTLFLRCLIGCVRSGFRSTFSRHVTRDEISFSNKQTASCLSGRLPEPRPPSVLLFVRRTQKGIFCNKSAFSPISDWRHSQEQFSDCIPRLQSAYFFFSSFSPKLTNFLRRSENHKTTFILQ